MELYHDVSYQLSQQLTRRYSTSFALSSCLLSKDIRHHIYAIYGLVRIADEVVDTYMGDDAATRLQELEDETARAIRTGYSVNPIVQAFALTAQRYAITASMIQPFFDSMRMDLTPRRYTTELYATYIYGSAEVIGLMCLRVFCNGNDDAYANLRPGAQALGAAYQKVNFLRDINNDALTLHRMYFPDLSFETFDDTQKQRIERDIERDFAAALPAIRSLPRGAKAALMASYDYYYALFRRLQRADAATITQRRIRVNNGVKLLLLAKRALLR